MPVRRASSYFDKPAFSRRKTSRDFLYSNYPTILVTPIRTKDFRCATSVKKFLGIGNRNLLAKEIIAHLFSKFQDNIYPLC